MTDQPPLLEEPALMAGLGKVISRWAYIDYLLGEFVAFLVEGKPALMYVITNNVSGSTLSDWRKWRKILIQHRIRLLNPTLCRDHAHHTRHDRR
jgi:hypothetical protein